MTKGRNELLPLVCEYADFYMKASKEEALDEITKLQILSVLVDCESILNIGRGLVVVPEQSFEQLSNVNKCMDAIRSYIPELTEQIGKKRVASELARTGRERDAYIQAITQESEEVDLHLHI